MAMKAKETRYVSCPTACEYGPDPPELYIGNVSYNSENRQTLDLT